MEKYYAIEGNTGEFEVVRVRETGEAPINNVNKGGHIFTVYGHLVNQDEFQRYAHALTVKNENGIIAFIWDCYTYEQYKEVYEKEIVKV